MAEIVFENGQISNFQGLMTLTLTLEQVMLHTVLHHSSTSIYTPNFIEIKETYCGRTDVWTYETHFIRSTQKSLPKRNSHNVINRTACDNGINTSEYYIYYRCTVPPTALDYSLQLNVNTWELVGGGVA